MVSSFNFPFTPFETKDMYIYIYNMIIDIPYTSKAHKINVRGAKG